jgi:hypothetical protein
VLRQLQLIRLMPLLDGELKMVETQLVMAKKRRDVVWSRSAKMRQPDNAGIDMFASMFFVTSRADYLCRYRYGC